jgi:hypothetical protein
MNPNLERWAAIQEGEEIQSMRPWNRLDRLHLRALLAFSRLLAACDSSRPEQVRQWAALPHDPVPIRSGL